MKNLRRYRKKYKRRNYRRDINLKDKDFLTLSQEIANIFDILPKYIREPLKEDKFKYTNALAKEMLLNQEKIFNPYKVFKQIAEKQSGRTINALQMYARFRNEVPDVYALYNSYMYRRGYSAAQYFYKNAEFEGEGSNVDITLELPEGGKYKQLKIFMDMSNSTDLRARIT